MKKHERPGWNNKKRTERSYRGRGGGRGRGRGGFRAAQWRVPNQTGMAPALHEEDEDQEPVNLDPALEANQPQTSTAAAVPEIPRFPSTISWQNPAIKTRSPNTNSKQGPASKTHVEYIRARRQIQTVAPDQVADLAKPTWQKPDIFPQTAYGFAQHKSDMVSEALEAKQQDILTMKGRIAVYPKLPKENARRIEPAFQGKVFNDHLSPVLALPSIWSHGHSSMKTNPAWPTQAELLWNGDSRERNAVAFRCGRYLPCPRDITGKPKPFAQQSVLKLSSLDRTGPIFDNGPSPAEIQQANWLTDVVDETFENGDGKHFVGADLMSRIGEWGPSYPLDPHIEQIIANAEIQTGGFAYQMMTEEQRLQWDATHWWNSLTLEQQNECRAQLNNQTGWHVQQ